MFDCPQSFCQPQGIDSGNSQRERPGGGYSIRLNEIFFNGKIAPKSFAKMYKMFHTGQCHDNFFRNFFTFKIRKLDNFLWIFSVCTVCCGL